jgi:hypothetical protein
MLRKFVCAGVILVIGLGVAMADEFQAMITKVDGNNITFKKVLKKAAKGQPAEYDAEKTLPAATNVKVSKGKFNADTKKLEAGDAIESGLKNEMFSKIKLEEKGVGATITTDADNKTITEIITGGKGKKKKDA